MQRNLKHDIAVMKAERVSAVACFVTTQELQEYGINELLMHYQNAGLEIYHLAIVDGRVASLEQVHDLLDWLHTRLHKGQHIVMHCAGGLGRAGTMAACWLKSQGLSTEAAIASVRQARSPRAIETAVQLQFIENFASATR